MKILATKTREKIIILRRVGWEDTMWKCKTLKGKEK